MMTDPLSPFFFFQLPKQTVPPRPAALSSLYARTRWPVSPKAGAVMERRTAQMAQTNRQISVSMATWKQLSRLVSSALIQDADHKSCFYSLSFLFLRIAFFFVSSECCCCSKWRSKAFKSVPLNHFEKTRAWCLDSFILDRIRESVMPFLERTHAHSVCSGCSAELWL